MGEAFITRRGGDFFGNTPKAFTPLTALTYTKTAQTISTGTTTQSYGTNGGRVVCIYTCSSGITAFDNNAIFLGVGDSVTKTYEGYNTVGTLLWFDETWTYDGENVVRTIKNNTSTAISNVLFNPLIVLEFD